MKEDGQMKKKFEKFADSYKAARTKFIKKMEKPVAVMKTVFGWAIMLSLFVGGATMIGYVVAIILGGEPAAAITAFIKKYIIPGVTYTATVSVLFGLIIMYLSGQTALSAKKNKPAPATVNKSADTELKENKS